METLPPNCNEDACIHVFNIKKGTDSSLLRRHFESKKHGGGKIKTFVHPYNDYQSQAVIEFLEPNGKYLGFCFHGIYILISTNMLGICVASTEKSAFLKF